MKRIKFLKFAFVISFLLLARNVSSMPPDTSLPRQPQFPMCSSQLALVNYACSLLPATPPSSHDFHYHDEHHRHDHRHRHREHQGTPQEENCCRWLNDVDDACVCELLVRLPPFLSRPVHQYTITVHDTCTVTYNCGGSGPTHD